MATVVHHKSARRFELAAGNHVAILEYERTGDGVMALTHTFVPEALRGQGVGLELVAGALAEIKQRHWKIIPLCPFVVTYLRRHPEWNTLVVED
ncbi:MAG: N-acetyltransferase [Prevotellaceae bacterium]|jgi:predicted GNAT family acetyltransferase|nr:N-acetyltransferase [Prevotellaceae bacterium]